MENRTDSAADPGFQKNQPHYQKAIQEMTLFDDVFFSACAEKKTEIIPFILEIILNRILSLKKPAVQSRITNPEYRSVTPDVVVESSDGAEVFNIEVEGGSLTHIMQRIRYQTGMIDTQSLKKGSDYRSLKKLTAVVISKNDLCRQGLPIYTVRRTITENQRDASNGTTEIFVNGRYRGDDEIGKLMHDFSEADPDRMFYNELKEACALLKRTKEGVQFMSETLQSLINQEKEESRLKGWEEGKKEGWEEGERRANARFVKNLLADGWDQPQIQRLTGLNETQIQKLSLETLN